MRRNTEAPGAVKGRGLLCSEETTCSAVLYMGGRIT